MRDSKSLSLVKLKGQNMVTCIERERERERCSDTANLVSNIVTLVSVIKIFTNLFVVLFFSSSHKNVLELVN